jgi:hypothetical protein
MEAPIMNVSVNLVSGEVYTFDLRVEKPMEFLNKIRPTEVFQRPLHQFLGQLKTVSINPDFIEWIEMDTSEFPKSSPLMKTVTIRQLSPEAFKSWVTKNKAQLAAAMENQAPQNVLLAYGMASFKSGRSLQFEIRAKMERAEDRIKASQKIFNMPALFIYGEFAGLFLVNPKNIAVWQVVPGLKSSTFLAIPGELTGVQKTQ